ncbi:hypothetical protein B296_00008748 [Ensete ventricosum]|uniref:Uncharacterized protein n=1 Tax=Ensete ventricosum TaxID=4639 RepID=A0A427AP98_ENSVE|nr:hypothetical protein B296_00008748 [Ensete ventricosum]
MAKPAQHAELTQCSRPKTRQLLVTSSSSPLHQLRPRMYGMTQSQTQLRRKQGAAVLAVRINQTLELISGEERVYRCKWGDTHLIEDEALALAGATADRDDADGALDELEGSDGLRVHPELALFVAVYEADGPTGPGGSGRETRARVPRVGCWRWLLLRRRRRGGGRRSPAETKQVHHLSSLASTSASPCLPLLKPCRYVATKKTESLVFVSHLFPYIITPSRFFVLRIDVPVYIVRYKWHYISYFPNMFFISQRSDLKRPDEIDLD